MHFVEGAPENLDNPFRCIRSSTRTVEEDIDRWTVADGVNEITDAVNVADIDEVGDGGLIRVQSGGIDEQGSTTQFLDFLITGAPHRMKLGRIDVLTGVYVLMPLVKRPDASSTAHVV